MNKLISLVVLSLSTSSFAAVLDQGQSTASLDFSYTTANALYNGDGNTSSYGDASTTFMNYGFTFARGLGSDNQLDARVAYTSSTLSGGDFGGTKDGDSVSEVSEISLKWTRTITEDKATDVYAKFAHPGTNNNPGAKTDNDRKLFIGVNDFTSHLALGLIKSYRLSNLWSYAFDLNYTHRFQSDDVPDSDQMGGQLNFQNNWGYQYSDTTSLSMGFAYRETLSGPNIGGADFYAVKERLLGLSFAGSYFFPDSGSWLGASLFQKVYGANTDVSTTFSFNIGKYF